MKRWLIVLTLLVATGTAFSQELFMAGTRMELGMDEESLITELKEKGYRVEKFSDIRSSWHVWEAKPSIRSIGMITFTSDSRKLSWVSKSWGSFSDDGAMAFAKELFSLFASLSGDQPSRVIVQPPRVYRNPGIAVTDHEFLYPDRSKTISVVITESREHGNSISISEIIGR